MSTAEPPRGSVASLLREQRHRRHFLRADTTPTVVVMVVATAAQVIILRNDFLLLRGMMLPAVLVTRLVYLLVTMVAAVQIHRARKPRQWDRAFGGWCFASAVALALTALSRLPSGETLGSLFGHGVLICMLYLAQRGPLWMRCVPAITTTAVTLVLMWNPLAMLSSAARVTSTFALIALNIVGIVSARSFEEQRRKRFDAERDERKLRRELTAKMHELAAEKERAEGMSRARAAFFAAMSHEFRTPMNAVLGFSELLLDSRLDAQQHEYVQTIRESAKGLLGLLNDVLDFSKIDAGKLALTPAPFDLRGLATSIVAMMGLGAKAKSLDILLEMTPDVPDFVTGDDLRLRQVLLNLVSNAVKFTAQGRVRLAIAAQAVGRDEHEITFRVEDTGIGMTPEVMARIFQPFEQGEQGITRTHEGTGLGLAISQRIVQSMGGEIRVESESGRGSAFFFSIRLPQAEPIVKEAPAALQGHFASSSILVVDDHPINRRLAAAMLERLGCHPDLAHDGPSAIEAVLRKDYDIVFMDLQMPGMSGVEATERIVEKLAGKRLPYLVAMTAAVFEEDRNACRRAGMRDFLGKPIDIAQLAAVLAHLPKVRGRPEAMDPPTPILDQEPLEKLRQLEQFGEPGFVASICRDFLMDTPERLTRMRSALEEGDKEALEREAHSLKAVSASLGAGEMSSICARIEKAAHEGEIATLGKYLDGLSTEFTRVEPAITKEVAGLQA